MKGIRVCVLGWPLRPAGHESRGLGNRCVKPWLCADNDRKEIVMSTSHLDLKESGPPPEKMPGHWLLARWANAFSGPVVWN